MECCWSGAGRVLASAAMGLALFAEAASARAQSEDAAAEQSGAAASAPPPAGAKPWWDDHPVATEEASWIPGEGLAFSSRDELFSMAIRLRGQFLYEIERTYDAESEARDDPQQNLTVRRARITFAGHMWGKKTQYKVELAISPADLGMSHLRGTDDPPALSESGTYTSRSVLRDWYVQFSQLRDLNFRIGQWKAPFSRERVISSGDLQFVDRSLTNREFNLDRDIGVEFRSKDLFGLDKRLRYYAGVYNGDGQDQYELGSFGLMYLGRLEFLPLGAFEDYSEVDFVREQTPRVSIGVAYAHVDDAAGDRGIIGRRLRDGGVTDYHNVSADVMFKFRGISLETMWFYRDGERERGDAVDPTTSLPVATEAARNGWGGGAQAGYLMPFADLELAARYNAVRRSGSRAESSLGDANEVAIALSYYFARHSLKLQGDCTRYWGEGSGAGRAFAESEELYRAQLQAAF